MKKYGNYFLAILPLWIGFLGCDDIIEEDISDVTLTLVAPADAEDIEGNSVQFRWNAIAGADQYRVQVNNREMNAVVLDSVVETTIFDVTIEPGTYDWRVRGENFAYETPYSFDSSFTVVLNDDLSNQRVTLVSPANEAYFDDAELTFEWQLVEAADTYTFEILEDGNTTPILSRNDVIDTTFPVTSTVLTADGKYTWQVSAQNAMSTTISSGRTFYIDTTAPPIPELTAPLAQTFNIDEEITFEWEFAEEAAGQSAISASIQVASDNEFNTILVNESTIEDTFIISLEAAGNYYWRVRGIDAAGNVGEYSTVGDFIISN